MSGSSLGDFMDLSVGRSCDDSGSVVGAKGWFDIKKCDGKTGEITDYSGPNAITLAGLKCMLRGFQAGYTADTVTAAGKVGIRFSGATAVDLEKGSAFAIPATTANISESTSTSEAGDLYFQGGSQADIFTSGTFTDGTSDVSLASSAIKIVASGVAPVTMIVLVDETGTDRAIAGRSSHASSAGTEAMTAITLANTDTLTVTYTITLTAT